jgi:hypothetical protein
MQEKGKQEHLSEQRHGESKGHPTGAWWRASSATPGPLWGRADQSALQTP